MRGKAATAVVNFSPPLAPQQGSAEIFLAQSLPARIEGHRISNALLYPVASGASDTLLGRV